MTLSEIEKNVAIEFYLERRSQTKKVDARQKCINDLTWMFSGTYLPTFKNIYVYVVMKLCRFIFKIMLRKTHLFR